jgi:competence protein ComEA
VREQDEAVAARLRAIFEVRRAPAPGGPADAFADRSPLSWSDLVPSWPEDMEFERHDDPPRRMSPPPSSLSSPPSSLLPLPSSPPPVAEPSAAPIDPSAWGVRPAWGAPSDHPRADPSAAVDPPRFSAFTGGRLAAFDPGRHGAKALAAVAAVVVAIAAFFAWRARPHVDPVPPPPAPTATEVAAAPSAAPSGAGEVVVSVAGKVGRPGLVRLAPGARVADAITAAGGARPGVDVALLNPARKVVDGELILVGVSAPPGTGPVVPAAGGAAPGGPVNLNAATLADLDGLPGVGPVLAQRILDARDAQGGFKTVADLRKVQGIGDSRYADLKDLVTV